METLAFAWAVLVKTPTIEALSSWFGCDPLLIFCRLDKSKNQWFRRFSRLSSVADTSTPITTATLIRSYVDATFVVCTHAPSQTRPWLKPLDRWGLLIAILSWLASVGSLLLIAKFLSKLVLLVCHPFNHHSPHQYLHSLAHKPELYHEINYFVRKII